MKFYSSLLEGMKKKAVFAFYFMTEATSRGWRPRKNEVQFFPKEEYSSFFSARCDQITL
jgi:hypothetical protein